MANKSVLCVTWNLELQCPDNQALKDSFVDYVKDKKPAVIAIGLQEAAAYSSIGEVFVGSKLASPELLGKDYELISTAHFKGITKGAQVFGMKAQQVLQILARKAEKAKAAGHTKQKATASEKGFCFTTVTLAGKNLGFVSTHLSADTDVEKKKKEGETILKYLKEQAKQGTFDALFMMGDLNFRIRQGNNAGDEELVRANLCIPNGRAALMANDSFDPACFANLPFIWPPFEPSSLPTYKRKKEKAVYPAIRALKGKLDGLCNSLRDIYPVTAKKDRAGYWDFGWLDRIGYAVLAPKQHNVASGLAKGFFNSQLKIDNADGLQLKSWYFVPFGDHAPVYADFNLSGF